MSLQWTLIAGYLYFEIFLVLLLVLPIASPRKWQRVFRSRFLLALERQASWYFIFILFILVLFLLDSIREMRKYSNAEHNEHVHSHLDAEMQTNMRLFRAQRNFYISGFALFLLLVLRRLVTLINTQANLIIQHEAAIKQAESASAAAQKYLQQSEQNRNEESEQNSANEAGDNEINGLKSKISSLEEQLKKETLDKDTMQKLSTAVSEEYDRLLLEHKKLQASVGNASKKDD